MTSEKVYELIKMIKRDPFCVTLDEILGELDTILDEVEELEDENERLKEQLDD